MPKQARIAPVSSLATRAASAATASAIVPETVKAHEGAPNQNEEDEAKIAPVVPVTVAKKEKGSCGCLPPLQGSKRGFITLTLMTFSVLLFLTPNELYFSLLFAGIDPPGMYQTAKIHHSLATVFDPILLVIANRDLQKALMSIFKCQ